MLGGYDEAPVPVFHFFNLEGVTNPIHKSHPAGLAQSNKQKSLVSPRGEAADVREIQILCDEKASGALCCVPDARVVSPGQPFLGNRIRFMTELRQNADQPERQVFIQFDFHGMLGMLGTGRSSSAEAAAKAITARISSSFNVGKSSMIS